MILEVHHAQITVPKGAEAEAREFYCAFLGLREIEKPENLRGRGGFWLEVGGFPVHVGVEDGVDRAKSKAHLAYLVDNLVDMRSRLSERGLVPQDGIPIPGFDRFECRDPFGNRMEFLERSGSD